MDTGEVRGRLVVGPTLPSSRSTEALEWEQWSGILENPADTPKQETFRVPIESCFSNSCRLRKEDPLGIGLEVKNK